MNITGVKSGQAAPQKLTREQSGDFVIKNLQSQISELQKQLQQLSKDDSSDKQALADKRKEIQQQIADLNAQIRQRQAEIRKEKQQPKETSEPKSDTPKQAKNQEGFSLSESSNLLAASNTLQQSKAVGGVIARSEGRANILKSEIATDKSRGADTTYKEKELSKVNKGIQNAKETQAKLTADSQKGLKSESKEEEKKAEDKQDEDDIKTEGKYDKDGRLIEETDPEENDYEDKA